MEGVGGKWSLAKVRTFVHAPMYIPVCRRVPLKVMGGRRKGTFAQRPKPQGPPQQRHCQGRYLSDDSGPPP